MKTRYCKSCGSKLAQIDQTPVGSGKWIGKTFSVFLAVTLFIAFAIIVLQDSLTLATVIEVSVWILIGSIGLILVPFVFMDLLLDNKVTTYKCTHCQKYHSIES